LNFKNAINAMQEEDWEEAAAQMLDSRWADQVGQRAHRLAKAMIEDQLEV
jgi:lysozyme